MFHVSTGSVILHKVVQRQRFTLGKSRALSARDAVIMDNGEVWIVAHRRPEHFLSNAHLTVGHPLSRGATFESAVEQIRAFEAEFITEESAVEVVK